MPDDLPVFIQGERMTRDILDYIIDSIYITEIHLLRKTLEDLRKEYPALQKGVARDPKPDEMNLQQGRKSPTRKPLQRDHPASSHKKKKSFYWTKDRVDILQENFFKKSIEELMELLPGATHEDIQAQARYLGMVLRKTGEKNEP